MKRHPTASAVSIDGPHASDTASLAGRTRTAYGKNTSSRERNLTLASVRVWTHTLVPTGELNRRSAPALELAIERLCEEGVTGVTLDLRELRDIDETGVAVIVFQASLCKRRGYDFALIPGSTAIQRAFDQADVTGSLPFQDAEIPSAPTGDAVLGLDGIDEFSGAPAS